MSKAHDPMTDDQIREFIVAQAQTIGLIDESARGFLHHVIWQIVEYVRQSDKGKVPNPFTSAGKRYIEREVEEITMEMSKTT
jgi:hypothetical protein